MISINDIFGLGKELHNLANRRVWPEFRNVQLGGILPEAIATVESISETLNGGMACGDSLYEHLHRDELNGWCGELRLRAWLVNKAQEPLRIVGILPNKQKLEVSYRSAVVFPPQGFVAGDAVRFVCGLDNNGPSMKSYKIENGKRSYTSSEYYFDEGILEVMPSASLCLSVVFGAYSAVYEVTPELVVDWGGKLESISIPLERRAIVCPISFIPNKEKYVRTFSGEPPYIAVNPGLFDRYMHHSGSFAFPGWVVRPSHGGCPDRGAPASYTCVGSWFISVRHKR